MTMLNPSHLASILTGITKNRSAVMGIRGKRAEKAATNPQMEPDAPTKIDPGEINICSKPPTTPAMR